MPNSLWEKKKESHLSLQTRKKMTEIKLGNIRGKKKNGEHLQQFWRKDFLKKKSQRPNLKQEIPIYLTKTYLYVKT